MSEGRFVYHKRDVWNAQAPQEEEMDKLKHPLDYVIFTHTVMTGTFNTNEDCIQALQECQHLHMTDPKWADIGFNFLVGNNGIVYEGRGWNYEGATAKGWNGISLGIAFLGTYLETLPSREALEATKLFLQDLVNKGILAPQFTIHCLRQVRSQFTRAPGDPLYKEIQTWKGTGPESWAWREVDYADDKDIPSDERLSETHRNNLLAQKEYFQRNIKTPLDILNILMEKGALSKGRYSRIKNSSNDNDDVISKLLEVCSNGRKSYISMLIEALLETSQRLVANTVFFTIPKEERTSSHQFILSKKQVPKYQRILPKEIIFDETFGEVNRKVELGEGSFGVVFRGTYKALGNQKVAIKRVKGSEYAGLSEREKRDFLKEASTMYTLRHPRIVTIYGVVCDDDSKLYCLVMEYMELGSLDTLMDKIEVPWSLKVRMLVGVSEGLMFLNNKQHDRPYTVTHCDVKARNILINEMFQAKVADFGQAVIQNITSRSTIKTSDKEAGTVTHVAPELLDPTGDTSCYDPTEKSDVWSFGITIFEVCAENVQGTGERRTPFPKTIKPIAISVLIGVKKQSPFTKEQMKKVDNSGCPQFLLELMKECCTINPEERPTFKKITAELAKYYDKECQQVIHTALGQAHQLYQENILGCKLSKEDSTGEDYYSGVIDGDSLDEVDLCVKSYTGKDEEAEASGASSLDKFQDIVEQAANKVIKSQEEVGKKLASQMSLLSTGSVTEEGTSYENAQIQTHFEELVQDIMYDNLEPNLIQSGALTHDDCERIKHARTSRDQNMVLLKIIDKKGEECVQKLSEALEADRMEHLSKLLNP